MQRSPISKFDGQVWKHEEPDTADHELLRRNIGQAVRYAHASPDLASLNPHSELSTAAFCLADPGREYIVFQLAKGEFTVHGLRPGSEYRYEHFDTESLQITGPAVFTADSVSRAFRPNCSATVLYIWATE